LSPEALADSTELCSLWFNGTDSGRQLNSMLADIDD
jgi:hypothetical protein